MGKMNDKDAKKLADEWIAKSNRRHIEQHGDCTPCNF